MSETTVNIAIKTTANTAGSQAAEASLKQLSTELKETQRQMHKLSESSPDYAQVSARADELKGRLNDLGESSGRAATKGGNFAQAMLQGSRGVQDFAAAGIPGMVNNVESLATAMGVGAGAAGGLTLAFVGLELVMKNWPAIMAAFGGVEKTKAFWAAMTPDEAYTKKMNDAATAQERLADGIQRAVDARKAALEAQQAEDDWLEKRKKLWEDQQPKDPLPPLPGTEKPSKELTKAARDQAGAEAQVQGSQAKFAAADKAVQDQEARVNAINKVATFDERLKAANAQDKESIGKLNLRVNRGGQVESPGDYAKLDELQKRIQERGRKLRSELTPVPGLTDGLTGDPEKDRESLGKRATDERAELERLKQERYQKAQAAESDRGQLDKAIVNTNETAKFDAEKRQAEAYKQLGLPPAPGAVQGNDAAAGFVAPIEQQGTQVSNALKQVSQSVKGVFSQLQGSSSEMQQGLTQALGGVIENQSAVVALIRGLQPQIDQIKLQLNTR